MPVTKVKHEIANSKQLQNMGLVLAFTTFAGVKILPGGYTDPGNCGAPGIMENGGLANTSILMPSNMAFRICSTFITLSI